MGDLFNIRAPLSGGARGFKNLAKFTTIGHQRNFLRYSAFSSVDFLLYDFTENAAIGDYRIAVANSGGAGAANFSVTANASTIAATTGTTDNGSLSAILPICWYGDKNAGMEICFKVDDVSEANIEFGFIDAVPAANASGVSDVDTPAAAAADCALMQWDTDQTATGLYAVTIGSTAGQGIKATSVATFASLADATYYTARIQLINNSAYFFWGTSDDTVLLGASHDDDPQGNLEGGVALAPWFYARTRNTTAKAPTIDYLAVWQDRV